MCARASSLHRCGCLVRLAAAAVIVVFCALNAATAADDLCADNCECTSQPPPNQRYHQLNCTDRQLGNLFADYSIIPSASDDAHPHFINIIYDDNPLKTLQPLPATNNSIAFSCRRCALATLTADAFAAIKRIERLDLSQNQLDGASVNADTGVFRGATIVELVLAGNRIESLAAGSFATISALRRVDLRANRLTQLTGVLVALPQSVRSLDVSGNLLTEEHEDAIAGHELAPLVEINLANNTFEAMPSIVRQLSATLRSLQLGGAALRTVAGVRDLGALRWLCVHDAGALQTVDGEDLVGLPQLVELHLTRNRNLRTLNVTGLWSSAARTLRTIDVRDNALTTVQLSRDGATEVGVAFGELRMLRLAGNPWHCDCALYRSLVQMMETSAVVGNGSAARFESEFNARCRTPHAVATDFLVDLLVDAGETACAVRNVHKPVRWVPYEPPAFLRPRQILLSVLSVLAVVLLGLAIGVGIACVQRRLRESARGGGAVELRDSPVRYTTVRNSTTVPVARSSVRVSAQAMELGGDGGGGRGAVEGEELQRQRQERPLGTTSFRPA